MEVFADSTVACPANCPATTLQIWGAVFFGALIGWFVYFINRYRVGDVQLSDIVTLLGVVGAGAILTLFPAKSDLFGAYGIGLFSGFFLYFLVLIFMVRKSPNFSVDWFLDGRRTKPGPNEIIPDEVARTVRAMGETPPTGPAPRI
jgi:hypothetical protein